MTINETIKELRKVPIYCDKVQVIFEYDSPVKAIEDLKLIRDCPGLDRCLMRYDRISIGETEGIKV